MFDYIYAYFDYNCVAFSNESHNSLHVLYCVGQVQTCIFNEFCIVLQRNSFTVIE